MCVILEMFNIINYFVGLSILEDTTLIVDRIVDIRNRHHNKPTNTFLNVFDLK